jgi:hypothetical protein
LSTLVEFAEHGPTFVSAKMRSIELQLQQVVEGKAAGDALDEAADQARRLLVSLASMSLQVRDLMPELSKAETTAQFARQWFERYVGQFFIGDYADLHKADHPLARRSAILSMAQQIETGERARAAGVVSRACHRRRWRARASQRLRAACAACANWSASTSTWAGSTRTSARPTGARWPSSTTACARRTKLDVLLRRACRGVAGTRRTTRCACRWRRAR